MTKQFSVPSEHSRNVAGWLFLNGEAVDDIRQLTGAGGKGTVDELGFQPLYDRIAISLFPWCSTLTTRARYFFFSLAVLDRGLGDALDVKEIDENLDAVSAIQRAEQQRHRFERRVQRAERALALALVSKYGSGSGEGIFGSIRCRQWAGDKNLQVQNANRVLSTPGRYPNAIYRGASRVLQVFASDSSTTGLLTAALRNEQPFASEWREHARRAMEHVRAFDEFWEDQRRPGTLIVSSLEKLETLPSFKAFRGFRLDRVEAKFLLERIGEATPYVREIKVADLKRLVDQPTLDLLALRAAVTSEKYKQLLLAAYHIDIATRSFRTLYQRFVEDGKRAREIKLDIPDIRSSIEWLDAHYEVRSEWCEQWMDLSPILRKWLVAASLQRSSGGLVDLLCERAEDVVSGRGKVAPHKRARNGTKPDNTDIRRELEIQESSFRLGNGKRILMDIMEALST